MSADNFRGRPRFNSVQANGGFVNCEQTPVYGTLGEALYDGPGWLYWTDTQQDDHAVWQRLKGE